MKVVIFGLTISSSWGNGHATLWRGLCKALAQLDHEVVFFERDTTYYAGARDYRTLPAGELVLYGSWEDVVSRAQRELGTADAAIVTSYCPDGVDATQLLCDSNVAVKVFYDLDTPVTLSRLAAGESLCYIGSEGLRGFDLVLSYTGGAALDQLQSLLGAGRVAPLYGHVDPDTHRPAAPRTAFRADLSYLGTYAADRQAALDRLLLEPARQRAGERFLIGGAQYPQDFPWSSNIYFVRHIDPPDHPAFFASSRLTLNVTRAAMARMGWCPSGRLFEAAACETAIISDVWPGLADFFAPGEELLHARDTQDVLHALAMTDAQLSAIARRARERVLDEHTCRHRAQELVNAIESTACTPPRSVRTAIGSVAVGACGA